VRARVAIAYAARGPSSPASLRMRYLVKALKRKGVETEELVLPQRRLAYLKLRTIKREKVLFSVPPAYVAFKVKGEVKFADVRDPWDVYVSESGLLKRAFASFAVRKYLSELRRSELVVTTTRSIAEHYERELKRQVYVIENGTDPNLLKCPKGPRAREAAIVADFSNPYLPLEPFLKVAKELGIRTKLIGPGSERAGGTGPVAYERLPEVCCGASVGVVPRPWKGRTYQMTVPVKAYDYMALGLCIFAYGPPNSELQKLIEENGIGVYVSNKVGMKEGLRECLETAEEAGRRARRLAVERFNRELLAERYADLLLKLL